MLTVARSLGFLLVISPALMAQDLQSSSADGGVDANKRIDEIRQTSARHLNIIAPTLPVEEIDRAVLNRLMLEIANNPEASQRNLQLNEAQLQDIFVTISNARTFINDSEMANIRAMCAAWNDSQLKGEARISRALDAYKVREQFTRDFIQKYYRIVLLEIESVLTPTAQHAFSRYMDDRRRRMANAGIVTTGAIVQNTHNGAETIRFHCRDQQD